MNNPMHFHALLDIPLARSEEHYGHTSIHIPCVVNVKPFFDIDGPAPLDALLKLPKFKE